MAGGVYAMDGVRPEAADTSGPLVLRARVWLRRARLDDSLARGIDPVSSAELELRALQLCSAKHRGRLARSLVRVLSDARRPAPLIRPQVPVRRREIRECEDDLTALIRRLSDGEPVDPCGVALTQQLLTDGAGPLYHEAAYSLRYSLRSSRLALDPIGMYAADLPRAA
ncbi:MAG TPA: hypothetical protein VFL87_08540 [Thermoleophilaceae bacterium]|nr:hypothetical protein [Thermoleophilaceae bacterium]